MIADKYSEINLDNTVKLLVRCKQMLKARQVAFNTLKSIIEFEETSKKLRFEINRYLEMSPKESMIKDIKELALVQIVSKTQFIVDCIITLRD